MREWNTKKEIIFYIENENANEIIVLKIDKEKIIDLFYRNIKSYSNN